MGRLEIGTETIIDKSKSIKTTLMDLFKTNKDIEGIQNVNACYGGTAALFNSLDWLVSHPHLNQYAIVIATDIAIYPAGPARATGGAGAVAMLLGRNPKIVIDKIRATHITNSYDFYKPNPNNAYPLVDG